MKKVFVVVFDGFADWELGFVLPELQKSNRFQLVTVGFSRDAVISMGGLKVVPDETLEDVETDNAALLLVPGGDRWENESSPKLVSLLQAFQQAQIPVAAICGATLEVARAGLTGDHAHTSNDLGWLQHVLPSYQDSALYRHDLAVTDGNLITANGVGAIEFTREIMTKLEAAPPAHVNWWFQLFKHGIWTEPA
jgi:putative intracellular protease/amidase